MVINAAARYNRTASQKEDILTIDLCDISAYPHKYKGRTVRTHATYTASFEGSTLYKADCPDGEEAITAVLDCADKAVCDEWIDKLHKDAEGNPFDGESVGVIVVGRIEARFSPGIKSRGNSSSAMFYIKEVELITPLSKSQNDINR
jgi:hypothetical protein